MSENISKFEEKFPSQNPSLNTEEEKKKKISKNKPSKTNPKKKKSRNYMLDFLKRIIGGGLIAWILLTFVFGITTVKGNYMFPALRDGDLIITFKIGDPVSSETVAYKTTSGIRLGRVVAMEKDEVGIKEDGVLTINGIALSEEIFYPTTKLNNSVINFPYIVPDDSVFILNDYRSLEEPDSREYGAILRKNLRGKVIFVFRRRGF